MEKSLHLTIALVYCSKCRDVTDHHTIFPKKERWSKRLKYRCDFCGGISRPDSDVPMVDGLKLSKTGSKWKPEVGFSD